MNCSGPKSVSLKLRCAVGSCCWICSLPLQLLEDSRIRTEGLLLCPPPKPKTQNVPTIASRSKFHVLFQSRMVRRVNLWGKVYIQGLSRRIPDADRGRYFVCPTHGESIHRMVNFDNTAIESNIKDHYTMSYKTRILLEQHATGLGTPVSN